MSDYAKSAELKGPVHKIRKSKDQEVGHALSEMHSVDPMAANRHEIVFYLSVGDETVF